MSQLEAPHALWRGLFNADILNPRVGRTAPHSLNHSGNVALFPGKVRLDGAVGRVSNPAADAQFAGDTLRPCTIEYALHEAGYADVAADHRHHTVEISGASSAFMPTTL